MLRGISPLVSPELLEILCAMGHGDELVIGDGNFPARSMSQRLVRCDGNTVPEILEAILPLFPLDDYVDYSAILMDIPPHQEEPNRWAEFQMIIEKAEKFNGFKKIERFEFYERAKQSFLIVSSGDLAIYANIILKKAVI